MFEQARADRWHILRSMATERKLWGIHNDSYGQELIDDGYVSIGWPGVGDLRAIGNDQARMRDAVAAEYPGKKPGAIAGWAGTLRRFAFEMEIGDYVVFPNKQDRTLNFGRITSPYRYEASHARQPHRRSVEWCATGVARSTFSQPALYEVGSAIIMFAVRNHAEEFFAFIDAPDKAQISRELPSVDAIPTEEESVEAAAEMPSAERIDQHTRDFIADVILQELTHEEFEYFTVDLLRCMGYQARVTPYQSDGGIDVIAHKDLLGVEPPIIKIQCKHTVRTHGRPEVQQLIGTLDKDEAGLFFTLGSFSSEALTLERERQNLRLFSGADITDLAIEHYDDLPSKWRQRLPLRRVLAVDTVS